MAKDNLQLIIGTVPTGYDTDAIKQTAKAIADAIDKYIMDIITKKQNAKELQDYNYTKDMEYYNYITKGSKNG